MHDKLNKRGLAEIVQVMVMTLLSIVAIATVSSYVIRISSLEQLSPAVDCLTMQSSITRACVNSNGDLKVMVNSFEESLTLNLGINNNLFECGTESNSCQTCILEVGSKEIILNGPNSYQLGDTLTYSFNGCQAEEKQVIACVGQ